MRRRAALLLFLAGLAGWVGPAGRARADEEGFARVFVNGVDRGDFRFARDGEALLFTVEDLRAMGFASLPRGAPAGPGDWVSLRNFFPPIFAEFDAPTSTLHLRADPTLLGRRVVDVARRPRREVFTPGNGSALFNYGIHWARSSDAAIDSLTVPGEVALSGGGFALVSSATYDRTGTRERWTRGMTTLSADEPARNLRFVVGDTFASSGSFGSSVALAGFGVSTEFSMTPSVLTRVGLDVGGLLRSTSDVEVWVNDVLVRKERFAPGEFEVTNLPGFGGAADVTLVIRDAFGREQRIESATYVASQLLPPGLHDFSYAVGVKRIDLTGASFDYGGPALLAYHRAGLTASLTGGLRLEADERVVNGGPTATLRVGRLGELDLAGAYSRRGAEDGFGGSAAWTFSARRFFLGLTGRAFSRGYERLTALPSTVKLRTEGTASLGLRAGRAGSVGVSYRQSWLYDGGGVARAAFNCQRAFGRSVSLMLTGGRTEGERTTWDASASLIWHLGGRTSGTVGVGHANDATSATAALQRGAPLGPGYGYRLGGAAIDAGAAGARTARADAFLEYHGDLANLAVEYGRRDARDVYGASLTGALALVDESLHLSRPIRDGFALVKVGDQRGVPVLLNHQLAGTTGTGGALLVPGLSAFYDALLSIDVGSLPVDYQVSRPARRVSVGYRNGGIVPFEIRRQQAISGRLLVVEGLHRTVPELWGLEVLVGHQTVEAVVGRGGEFYLENLAAGLYAARIFTKGRSCPFVLKVPASREPWLDLGEVRCVPPGGGT